MPLATHPGGPSARRAVQPAVFLVALLLAAAPRIQPAAAQPEAQAVQPVFTGPVLISELLKDPTAAGAATSQQQWVELANRGPGAVNLQGWALAESPNVTSDAFVFPTGVVLQPGAFVLVNAGRGGDEGPALTADFRLGSNPLYLMRPDGAVVSASGQLPKEMGNGVTFGIPSDALLDAPTYAPLQSPTPGAPNAATLRLGPRVYSVRASPAPKPTGSPAGQPIVVSAAVAPRNASAPVTAVTLDYVVNYGAVVTVPMTPAPVAAAGDSDDDAGPRQAYEGTIPPTLFKPGDLVRWRVQATDASGASTLDPPPGAKPGEGAEFEGTVIAAAPTNITLPVLHWYTPNETAATTEAGGTSTLFFNGTLYDNVLSQRKGVTTLNWLKPKMKFRFPGSDFRFYPDGPRTNNLKTNSFFQELGENSYMREPVAYQVLREAGVPASVAYHAVVHMNGRFWGLVELVQDPDEDFLKHYGLPTSGPLFKSVSGELSNLRWDLPIPEMPSYWGKGNRKSVASDWQLLANFSIGLAGGGAVPRSKFLFDALDLPAVINEMAAQALLNNMDRCTKNFLLYLHPVTLQWQRLPWDVEASMGQDNGLGGAPGPYYCVLACEQWNSPLYCDSEHPQDAQVQTSWGTINVVGLNPYQGAARGAAASGGRRLRQQAATAAAPAPALLAEGKPNEYIYPAPQGWDNPDRNTVGTRSVNGAPGTYNHLTDAVLDVNATRAMYLRRLRTLADAYYAGGRLRQIVDETHARIKPAADEDHALWKRGDIARGHAQLATEFLPIRARQLLGLYAPGGARPLLPGPQRPTSTLRVGVGAVAAATAGGAAPSEQAYVALANREAEEAVDVSGWSVSNGAATFKLPAGTVIPPGSSAYLTPSPAGFRARAVSPRGGEGLLVVYAPEVPQLFDGSGASWSIRDAEGVVVSEGAGA